MRAAILAAEHGDAARAGIEAIRAAAEHAAAVDQAVHAARLATAVAHARAAAQDDEDALVLLMAA
jgi:hypothetical protein